MSVDAPADAAEDTPVKVKKDKKSKQSKSKPSKETSAKVEPAKAEKVKKAKRSKANEPSETETAEIESTKDKKRKRQASDKEEPKKQRNGKDKAAAWDSEAPGARGAADNWNVSALEGGAQRQNKFMKLLGGGKAAASTASGTQKWGVGSTKDDVRRQQEEIQRQYDAGMRLKFEGQGQRKGLGA